MIITADFSGVKPTVTTESLYQWDTGQRLKICGLNNIDENTQVHFANAYMIRAIVKEGTYSDGELVVDIPNEVLRYGNATPVKAWVYINSDTEGRYTIRTAHIPVIPRKCPNDYVSTEDPDAQGIIEHAVELLENYETDIAGKVSKPISSPNGTNGQLLRSLGDGNTEWVNAGLPTDAQTATAVSEWLAAHPEITTSLQDGEVTNAKIGSGAVTASKLGADVNAWFGGKVSKPSTSPNGTNGQLLRTKGDGTTEWVDVGLPTDAQTAEAVSDWLDDHPEATTTVEDGSITTAKLHSGVIDSTLSAQGAAAEAKTTGEARNRFDSTVQGASSTNTSDSIYLKTGETAKITISDFDGTLISVFIKGHLSPSLPIYRDGVYKFTAQYDGLLRLYGAGTTTFIADVELMTLAAVRLENTQAQADSNTLEIDTLKDTVFSSVNGDVEQGTLYAASGAKYDTAIACRTASYTPQTTLKAVFNDGIKAEVRAYDTNGTYVGGYTGSGFSTDYKQFAKLRSPIALRDFTAEYGYNWKLVFMNSASGSIVPNDVGLQYEVSVIPDEAEIYTVGTNGDFSGFTEMLIALASNSKEKIVYVDGGVYDIFDEMGGAEYISSIEDASSLNWRDVNHIVPPNTTIIGVGKVVLEWNPSDSEIISQNHAFLFSPLNLSGSCTIKNIEIRCSNCRYGIHDETSGKAVYNGTTRVLDNVRVYFTASTYGTHYAYGAGHNKNSKYIYNNCVFSAAYGVAWSSHDWTATEYENSTFEFNNCIFKNNLPTSPSEKAGLRFSSSATDSRQDIVKINGCDFNSITFGTEGSSSVKQGYTVTTMLCPSFTVTYTDRIASEDRIAPTVYLTLS